MGILAQSLDRNEEDNLVVCKMDVTDEELSVCQGRLSSMLLA